MESANEAPRPAAVAEAVEEIALSEAVDGAAVADEVEARGDDEDVPVDDGEAPVDEAGDDEVEAEDGDAGDENLVPLSERLDGILESLLLAAGAPLTVRRMVEVIRGTNGKEVRAALSRLAEHYTGPQRGIHLVEVAGGWQFRTAPQNVHYVRVLLREKPARLGRAALETLSIVAYKQPATRAEIEAIRGVDADSALNTLLQKKLVKIAGRKEVVGRPLLYATTPEFLEVFGLKDLKELPTLKEIGPVAEPEDETDIEDEEIEVVATESDDEGEGAVDAGQDDDVAATPAYANGGANGAAVDAPLHRGANGDDDDDAEDDDEEEDLDDGDDDGAFDDGDDLDDEEDEDEDDDEEEDDEDEEDDD